MPRKPRDIEPSPRDLLEQALRQMLEAPATSGKALEAKASATRQFAHLHGLGVGGDQAPTDVPLPDPMDGLDDELAAQRAKRRATGTR